MATAELQGHSCMQSLFGKHLERVSLAKEAFFFFLPDLHPISYIHTAPTTSLFFAPESPLALPVMSLTFDTVRLLFAFCGPDSLPGDAPCSQASYFSLPRWSMGPSGLAPSGGGGEGLLREGVASCHAHLPANPVWPYSVSPLTWHPSQASSFAFLSSPILEGGDMGHSSGWPQGPSSRWPWKLEAVTHSP